MRSYSPRRAGKRWLEGAPAYVLDCLDNKGKTADRYTVLFAGEGDGTLTGTYVPVLSMSGAPTHPQGVSMWSEINAYQAGNYRLSCRRQRIRWLDLPEHIRDHVKARWEQA